MKCDELKAEPMIINDDYTALYYPKDPVDAAIDELKTENETLLQQNRELCRALQVMYTKEEYDKLKAENAELKAKLEDAKATAYAESFGPLMTCRPIFFPLNDEELEAFKTAFAAGKTSAEEVKKNAKMDELAGALVDFLKTLKNAIDKEAK